MTTMFGFFSWANAGPARKTKRSINVAKTAVANLKRDTIALSFTQKG
jgi:hypothetical protein